MGSHQGFLPHLIVYPSSADCKRLVEESRYAQQFFLPHLVVYPSYAEILEKINASIKKPLSNVKIGMVMKKLGAKAMRTKKGMTYNVIPLKTIDIETVERQTPVAVNDMPF